ncbi:hypothetical protein [Bacillus solimangrovi]|uniref:Uncharacterized protein n=1 Tax=Bacillus solimangrovi TaxID=1305675 RepID=A0A1E5LI64_9BACI|nr:hypothetical protein [Bacillus solimangrovi]OEH93751.1 hypothetical protein BFG57_11235 [Bacillus solimangrovi]
MGMPNFPAEFNSLPDFEKNNVLLYLLASVGSEELALAHIMNAEGEKIQAAVAAFEDDCLTIDDLLSVNDNVNDVLKTVIKKEMLLQFKVENVQRLFDTVEDC